MNSGIPLEIFPLVPRGHHHHHQDHVTPLSSNLDSTLNFEFTTSFCQQLPICHLFDLCHIFRKKAGLQGFIKKFVTPEPLEINN
jgi:hypothetical protein